MAGMGCLSKLVPRPEAEDIHGRGHMLWVWISYNYDIVCRHSRGTMKSAQENLQVICDHLVTELKAGRIIGPLAPKQYLHIHTSQFGIIPNSIPGKWWLIFNLSFPKGGSMNEGIRKLWCLMSYTTVTNAVQGITAYQRGALMIELDICSAYRVVPIHPDDRWLLGMMWKGLLFFDSAPKIFLAIADAVEWIVRQQGVEFVIHYLDNFLVVTAANELSGSHSMHLLREAFEQLELPLA